MGVDISQGMVDQYNKRVNEQGIASEEMKAVCIELQGKENELDGAKFDVIVVSMCQRTANLVTMGAHLL